MLLITAYELAAATLRTEVLTMHANIKYNRLFNSSLRSSHALTSNRVELTAITAVLDRLDRRRCRPSLARPLGKNPFALAFLSHLLFLQRGARKYIAESPVDAGLEASLSPKFKKARQSRVEGLEVLVDFPLE